MSQGPPGAFPATRPSVVRDLGSVDPAARAAAYEALARSYWRPVYAYVRLRWRRSPEDAQDLTQEFFARAFEREYLSRYDPAKARFRTFVRTCLDGFLANQDKAAGAPETRRRRHASPASTSRASTRTSRPTRAARSRIPSAGSIASGCAACSPTPSSGCARTATPRATPRVHALPRATTSSPDARRAADLRGPGARDRAPVTDVTNELAWARRAFREIVLDAAPRHVRQRRRVPRRGARPARGRSAMTVTAACDRSSDAAPIDRAARARRSARLQRRRATSCSRRSAAAAWGSCSAGAIASSIATSRSR